MAVLLIQALYIYPIIPFPFSYHLYLVILQSAPSMDDRFVISCFMWLFHVVYSYLENLEMEPHMNKNTWNLSFRVCVTSLSIIFSISKHLPALTILFFLHSWIVFHCFYVLHFHYLFICWKTFRLFLFTGYHEQDGNEENISSILYLIGAFFCMCIFYIFLLWFLLVCLFVCFLKRESRRAWS